MSVLRAVKNSFLGGMISPTAWQRTDLPTFPHSCRLLQNMIPRNSGGAYRRPGTVNVDSLAASTSGYTAPRLFPFVYSKTESYCILLTSAFGGSCTGFNYRMQNQSVTGGYQKQTLNIVGSGLPYGYRTFGEVEAQASASVIPVVDDDIFQIQYCQANDILYLFHGSYKPQMIVRTGLDTFYAMPFDYNPATQTALTGQALVSAYPYRNPSASGITMYPSATTGTVTITASANYFLNPQHVGSIFVLQQGSTIGAFQITAVTNGTTATATVLMTLGGSGSGNRTAVWWESAWSNVWGWPSVGAIFQQRLVAGSLAAPGTFPTGATTSPDKLWFSETANFQVFSLLGTTVSAGAIPAGTVVPSGATVYTIPQAGTYAVLDSTSQGDGITTGPTGSQPFDIALTQNTQDKIQWISPDKQLSV